MSIGSKIKCFRMEKGMTQEALANCLGITSRAVSQWECERTTPDISQLPALCHVFGVSADELLGIEIEKNHEKMSACLEGAQEAMNRGDFVLCLEILKEANCNYPRTYQIMERLANAFICVKSRSGLRDYEEVYELCNKILEECTDSMIRYRALQHMATAYDYAKKYDKMRDVAKMMPPTDYTYENFMVYRWKGDEALKERQKYMEFLLHELLSMITCMSGHNDDDGKMIFSWNERKALRKLELDLIEAFFPNGDYQYFAEYAEMVCSFFVADAFREKDYDKLWCWLNRGADFAIHADTYDFDAPHTSPILRGYSSGGWIMEAEGNRSQSMLEWLTNDDEAAALRTDARYEALVDRLKAVAKKP